MYIALWQNICLHFSYVLRLQKAEIKDGGLINVAEGILRQLSIQSIEWVLFATFSDTCEKYEQKPR